LPEEERTEANVMRMREYFIHYYNEHNADLSCPYPGVSDLLRWLQESGVMIAVASNKYQAATERLVAHYFPEIRFVKVYGQRTDVPIKPDPTVVMEIMDQAGVERNEVLYVGDSGVDMQTGRNAGVDTVGVSWGFRPKSELESFSPMAIVDHAEDLKKYVTAAK
jgi:phosphoglycolate phosphatase